MKRLLTCLLALIMLFQITACAADAKVPAFADVSADADYAQAVAWCVEKGLMNGVEDGTNFDPDARPAIANAVADMEGYDAVLIGYPIWWGRAPKIIHTFLETYDLSGKTIATFCTSGGSGHEDATIRGYEPDATWLEGRRFSGTSQVESWVNGLDLPKATEEETNQMYVQVGDTVWTASLEDNPSAAALKELLAKGPLSVAMHDYGGFEKVGDTGTTLPRTDRQITTKPGDIILYQGSSITIYYDENSWNFTLLGHLDGVTDAELREVLKAGGEDVRVTFSLEEPGSGS